jgi:VWFA-related protein
MRGALAGGGTALLDAVSVTLVDATPAGRRQLNVFFTDGNDTSSTTSGAILIDVAQHGRAALTFVMPALQPVAPAVTMFTNTPPVPLATGARTVTTTDLQQLVTRPGRGLHPLLDRLAADTGGSVITSSSTDLSGTFSKALEQFRSAYVLYYTATNVEKSGYHTLQVTVDRKDATVLTRRGYFGS